MKLEHYAWSKKENELTQQITLSRLSLFFLSFSSQQLFPTVPLAHHYLIDLLF